MNVITDSWIVQIASIFKDGTEANFYEHFFSRVMLISVLEAVTWNCRHWKVREWKNLPVVHAALYWRHRITMVYTISKTCKQPSYTWALAIECQSSSARVLSRRTHSPRKLVSYWISQTRGEGENHQTVNNCDKGRSFLKCYVDCQPIFQKHPH